jgi:hypothetical protein
MTEDVLVAVVTLPILLVPVAILYWTFSAGRRRGRLEGAHHRQRRRHDAVPND